MSGPVVLNQLGPRVTEQIKAAHPAARVVEANPGEGLPQQGAGVEVVLAFSRRRPDMVAYCAPNVRWVHMCGAGADRLPPELFETGRVVTASKGASAVPISEFVLASILAFEKRFPLSWIRAELPPPPPRAPDYGSRPTIEWEPPPAWGIARFGVLPGKTLGLLGYGGIGQAVAVRARAFGMEILALKRHPEGSDVELAADVHELVARSDHLVIAAPLTPRTRQIVDTAALAHAKPSLHIVNISRGGLIDQDALISALDEGRVAFASLDVTEPEPLPAGHRLFTHPRVHLTPHVSWSMPDNLGVPVELFIANLGRYVAGEPLAGMVDPGEGY
jgi:phosphoglycerate dehydrogenase-like enzyme